MILTTAPYNIALNIPNAKEVPSSAKNPALVWFKKYVKIGIMLKQIIIPIIEPIIQTFICMHFLN